MRTTLLSLLVGCSFTPGGVTARDDAAPAEDGSLDAAITDTTTAIDAPDGSSVDPERRIKVTFHNASRASNLDGFAALLKLDATIIDYAAVATNAVDLRFFDGDGTALPYEIESWDPTGTSFVWVRVPRIDASSDTDFIWLHYGDPAATVDMQNPPAVWTDAVGVWHLGDDPGPGNADDIKDSSTSARHGTASTALATTDRVAAVIGNGIDFPGTKAGITAAAVTLPIYTYTLWVRGDAAPATGSGNKQPLSNGDQNFNFSWDHNLPAFTAAAAHRDAVQWDSIASATLQGATWYFIAGLYNGTSLCMSVDGAPPTCIAAGAPNAPSGTLTIALASSSGTVSFAGTIDEVRILSVAKSADWLSAEYASQRANSATPFATFGAPEAVP